jgi:polyisoprenoid-binding protein YceI
MSKLVAVLASLTLSLPAVASTWKSDPAHSSATFSAKHMTVTTVRGTLGPITSTVEVDDKDLTRSKVEATIDASKINTGVEKRDTHLKSADFFEVAKYPFVTFKSKKIEKVSGDKYKVTGDLTIKTTTKEVVLDTIITPEVSNPFSKVATRGISATGSINREDFGLTWNVPVGEGLLVSKEIKIELEVEYQKDEAKVAAPSPAKK